MAAGGELLPHRPSLLRTSARPSPLALVRSSASDTPHRAWTRTARRVRLEREEEGALGAAARCGSGRSAGGRGSRRARGCARGAQRDSRGVQEAAGARLVSTGRRADRVARPPSPPLSPPPTRTAYPSRSRLPAHLRLAYTLDLSPHARPRRPQSFPSPPARPTRRTSVPLRRSAARSCRRPSRRSFARSTA